MQYDALRKAWSDLTAPGAPFETTVIEVRGAPMRIFKTAPRNVRDFWLSTAAFGERTYLVYQDDRLTYAETHRQARAVAAWLWAQGVRPGDRVGVAMRNYPEWLAIYWACCSIGAAAVGFNAWWAPDELDYGLRDARPKVVFCDAERLDRLSGSADALAGVTLVGVRLDAPRPGVTAWSEVIATPGPLPDADIDPDDDACVFYTSGTTGRPKGAQLTHRGCVNNLMNVAFVGQVQALAMARMAGLDAPPVMPPPISLLATPLFHVTANNCGAYAVTAAGGTIVLMYRWDPAEALRLIEQEHITVMNAVPVMARELVDHPDRPRRDLSSLLVLGGGGAQLHPDLVAKIDAEVGQARPNTGYGMTETSGIVTSVGGPFYVGKSNSVGPVMPTFEAKCVDDDGRDAGPGGVGELWVRGAGVIKGYLNRPEANAEMITEGWLHTGDVARIDADGFVYIVDRKKDMVLRGGENIYCAEVEACLHRHPAVAECSVFGVPDERLGEEVGAAVYARPGEQLTAEALREVCAAHMAKHKTPRYIWILPEPLPRNVTGKYLKRELRERLSLEAAS
ncbi:MAG: acyl--CoA ligase [Caulobacteraceae bacterium]|nr:acyl--CoA ligase [Caulobacteraceae bacterium]